jgi:hypothetical protein
VGGSGAIFHIFGEATASTEPGQRSFHDPTPGDDLKADCRVGPFDYFYFHMRQNFLTGLLENGTLVSAIGKEFLQNGNLPNKVPSTKTPPSRSWILGGCTTACSNKPTVSTRMWRFLPLILLPAS